MPSPRIVLLYLVAAAAIVAWIKVAPRLLEPPAPTSSAAPAIAPRPIPDFTLTDQRGEAVNRETLAGRVWIANFLFTSCPGPCLDLTKRMRALQDSFADRTDLSLVSFSIDPKTDTPERLAAYARENSAGPRWFFLTGEREITARVANEGFLFPLSTDPSSFDHSERIAVVDRSGLVRGWFDSHSPQLIEEVSKLVRSL